MAKIKKELKTEVDKADINYCTMQLTNKCSSKNGYLPISDFYSASEYNNFYKNGKFNICKNCFKEYVYEGDKVNEDKFKEILRIFNIPFYKKDFQSAIDDSKETIGVYMKNIYLNKKADNWNSGDFEDDGILYEYEEEQINDEELKLRWGTSWDSEEIQMLERSYHEWTTNNDANTLSVKKMIRLICMKEIEIMKARKNNKPTDKLEKSLIDLMNTANLTPKTMSAVNETDSAKIYGVWLKDIEKYKPAEYFKDKKLYEDFDGIKGYFERFVLRPMKNILTGTRDFDKEFMIEDEDDEGGDI